MFWRRPQDSLPEGWSRRHLTYWDNNQVRFCDFAQTTLALIRRKFAVNDSPTIAWIFEKGHFDQDTISEALKRAVRRRVPWLNARVARTKSGSVCEQNLTCLLRT
jgi:hypothetical protein